MSFATLCLATLLFFDGKGAARAQGPKDCVAMVSGQAATVHEGRYSILCVRPNPGPLSLECRVDNVPAPSVLEVYSYALEGAMPRTLQLSGNADLPAVVGTAGADAHVFFSYGGPFDPIVDGYTLTCRW